MDHHSFLIKQAIAALGIPALGGAAIAGLSDYKDLELDKRRNTLKDVIRGGIYGMGLGVGGSLAGWGAGRLLGAGARRLGIRAPYADDLELIGSVGGSVAGAFSGGRLAAEHGEEAVKKMKEFEESKGKDKKE